MEGVTGMANDGYYVDFSLDFINASWLDEPLVRRNALVRNSTSTFKGHFYVYQNFPVDKPLRLHYKDMLNSVDILFVEDRKVPLIKIAVGLSNPDRYHVSEFFLKGHLRIEKVNVINKQKTVLGSQIQAVLEKGKNISILDRLKISYVEEAAVKVRKIETEFGTIEQVKHNLGVEI